MGTKECPICYEKLGKNYKELECGHRYHFKCITTYEKIKASKNECDLSCPYCRKKYSNMKLRSELDFKLTIEEEINKSKFVSTIFDLLNQIEGKDKNKKLIIINKIFSTIIDNVKILKDKKFGFEKFVPVIINKVNELSLEISDIYKDNIVSKTQYLKFEKNKKKIETIF